MNVDVDIEQGKIRERLLGIAPRDRSAPDISVVVPVNAQGDLQNVLRLAADVAGYRGSSTLEMIFVVNNFEPDNPPSELAEYQALGARVIAIPDVRRPGEAVGFSARIPGVRAARSDCVILFDADCRVPNATALLDWYREVLTAGAHAAYTHVRYYDLEYCLSIRTRFFIHHAVRWMKRNVFRIPTTRGSNYAVQRTTMLELYESGMLADEMNVGPTFKRMKGQVIYSNNRALLVYTSGRMFRPGWIRIVPYYIYRLRYNLRVLKVRKGVAKFTGRETDPIRRYVNNQPVRPSK